MSLLFSSNPELRRTSDWTPWIRTNVTREGFVEQRFRFVCRANVPDLRMLRVSNVKTDYRFCPDSGDQCVAPGERSSSHKNSLTPALHRLCASAHVTKLNCAHPKRTPRPKYAARRGRRKKKLRPKKDPPGPKGPNDVATGPQGPSDVAEANRNAALLRDARRYPLSPVQAFRGYCGCRDLGVLRMCRKCLYRMPYLG